VSNPHGGMLTRKKRTRWVFAVADEKELYIRVMGIFRRGQHVRVRGEHAMQIPGKIFKFAFLVYFMGLMGKERFVNQRPECSAGLGDRFPDVASGH
jgi:hypothetical protein